jgi:hypothetical protein
MIRILRLTMVLVALVLVSSPAWSAETGSGSPADPDAPLHGAPAPGGGPDTRTFGPNSATAHTIGAYAFDPFSSTQTYAALVGTGDRYLTNNGVFLAPVNLPAGAQVGGIEIQGCDNSAAAEVRARFFSNTTSVGGAQSELLHALVSTGVGATPGCNFFFSGFSPITVDNFNRTYYIDVSNGAVADGSVRFSAVRLYYVLQVSPAPAVATFNDVPPDHTFFRFVEALAAAGITGGCSSAPPLYCPEEPVTRGQRAAFISKALGLHFAP